MDINMKVKRINYEEIHNQVKYIQKIFSDNKQIRVANKLPSGNLLAIFDRYEYNQT